jgi:hypothetical protein
MLDNYLKALTQDIGKNLSFPRVITVLLVVIFLTYFFAIDLRGIWGDEALRLRAINGVEFENDGAQPAIGNWEQVIQYVQIHTNYQPAYYLLQNTVSHITRSRSEIIFRCINIFIFVVAAFLLFLFTKTFSSNMARLSTIVYFCLNGFLMMHVLQIREYMMIVLLIIVGSLLFFYMFENNIFKSRIRVLCSFSLYTLLIVISFYTHLWAAFFYALHFPIAFLRKERKKTFVGLAAASWLLAGMSFIPWITSQYWKGKVDPGLWDDRSKATIGFLTDRLLDGVRVLTTGTLKEGGHALNVFVIVLFSFVFAIVFLSLRKYDIRKARLYYSLLCIVSFLVFQITYFFLVQPLSTWFRYFIVYHFFIAYLVGYSFDYAYQKSGLIKFNILRCFVSGLMVCIFVSGIYQVRSYYDNPYLDTTGDARAVAKTIENSTFPGELIVVSHYVALQAIRYYWHGENNFYYVSPYTVWDQVEFEAKLLPRVAFVSLRGFDDKEKVKNVLQTLSALNYREVSKTDVGIGLDLLHFVKTN